MSSYWYLAYGSTGARDSLVAHRRVPREYSKDHSRLSHILDFDGVGQVNVCVPGANVVVLEILDRRESRHACLYERHVIRTSDPLDHVPPDAQVGERSEPSIEDLLRRCISLHIETVGFSATRIVVEVDR